MSLSQASEDSLIIQTAPAVRHARKHMMAMTSVSERPVTEPGGTTGAITFILRPRSLPRVGT